MPGLSSDEYNLSILLRQVNDRLALQQQIISGIYPLATETAKTATITDLPVILPDCVHASNGDATTSLVVTKESMIAALQCAMAKGSWGIELYNYYLLQIDNNINNLSPLHYGWLNTVGGYKECFYSTDPKPICPIIPPQPDPIIIPEPPKIEPPGGIIIKPPVLIEPPIIPKPKPEPYPQPWPICYPYMMPYWGCCRLPFPNFCRRSYCMLRKLLTTIKNDVIGK